MAESMGLGGASSNPNVARIAIEQRKKKNDVVEPQVISEELLIEGVEEPVRPDGEPWEPIDFPGVTSLRLSFQNIIEVANLNNFDSLTTLRLDNNIIDSIANLNHLKQLTWLDLSFNNIREIEGLGELGNLLDLSLYHNQIEEIKGLDGCPKLNILSLGHNNIKELKQIDYLRKFQNLRCLCLDGNKVCQNDSYNQHVFAYLPTLKYLDYMLIDKKAVTLAQEGYGNMDELTEVREREQAEQAKRKARKEKDAIIENLKGAFLDGTEDLFEELFSKDVEPENVTVLTCYPQLKEDYRDHLSESIKNLRVWMEERNEGRVKKASAFEKAVTAAEKESEEEAFQIVRDFRSHKKKVLAQIDREDSAGLKPEMEAMIQQLLDQLNGLENHLMANEIQLQESIYEAISDFEARISEIVKQMSEKGGEFFRHLEELEKVFYTGLMEGANSEVEAFAQNQDLAATDDTNKARFLGNKEEMIQACVNFYEGHTSLIQNKEDYMSNQMNSWRNSFFERHRERQYHRNRKRVMDVKQVVDDCRSEITAASEVGDEYDENDGGGDMTYGR